MEMSSCWILSVTMLLEALGWEKNMMMRIVVNVIVIQMIPLIWEWVSRCFLCFIVKKNFVRSVFLCTFAPAFQEKWSVSSVGSERFLHTEEVESSNLPQTTRSPSQRGFFVFLNCWFSYFFLCFFVLNRSFLAGANRIANIQSFVQINEKIFFPLDGLIFVFLHF